jgi:hypothetical protein
MQWREPVGVGGVDVSAGTDLPTSLVAIVR